MLVDQIPSKLICITIGPDDNIQVPLPIGLIFLPMRNGEESEKFIQENEFLIVIHPNCNVGVLATITNVHDDGYNLLIKLACPYRVNLKAIFAGEDDRQFAEWEFLKDIPPTAKEFTSKAFQERIRELQRAAIKFIYLAKEIEMPSDLKLPPLPRGFSEKTVGSWIDRVADVMNVFANREEICKFLIAVLVEPDVKKRLETAIGFYVYCFKNVGELGKEFLGQFDEIDEKPPSDKEGKALVKKKEASAPNRRSLVQELIFQKGSKKLSFEGKKEGTQKRNIRIPRTPLDDHEKIKIEGLVDMHDYLSGRVIGQDRAIDNVIRAFNLEGAGMLPDWRPLAVLIFLGPTGVGKTELAISLGDYLYLREKEKGRNKPESPLVMVECGTMAGLESFDPTPLVGAPPGFVGGRDDKRGGGVEPKFSRRRFPPDRLTVLLLDEIDKILIGFYEGAKMLGILVQMLDKGKLETNWDLNNPVDFRNSIIIFTGNIAAKEIVKTAGGRGMGFHQPKETINNGNDSEELTEGEIRKINEHIYQVTKFEYEKAFPPELRNRIDRLVVFRFLTREEFSRILEKELVLVNRKLQEQHGMQAIELSPAAKEWLLRYGIMREYGVRSLQRSILRKVSDPLAIYLNAGRLSEGSKIFVDIDKLERREAKFIFSYEK